MRTLASASAPMPAPTPLADGRWLVATGTSGGAARVPGRLGTSLVAAAAVAAPAAGRDKKRGIARRASTAKAWVAVRLVNVRRQRVLPALRVHLDVVSVQRLTLPFSRQSALRITHWVVRFVHVDRVLTQRRTRRETVHVSGLGLGLGGVMTGVPWACAAPTAVDGAVAASPVAAGDAIATSANISAAVNARRRVLLVSEIVGNVHGAWSTTPGRGADNTSAMHG